MAEKIFIASASDTKESHAIPVAQALADAGFDVKRWWLEFKPGDFTLERLVQVSGEVQGAVFFCIGTDKTWYHGKQTVQARDNVIFELGLFLSQLTPGLAVVVSDASTKLPSDLEGLTYLPAGQDIQTIAERVVTHFKNRFGRYRQRKSPSTAVIAVEVDPNVSEASIKSPAPGDWQQRALYLGTEGARGWMAVVESSTYLSKAARDAVRSQILDVLKGIRVRSFISLGPGDAVMDQEVAILLSSEEPELNYFPVDISEGLLFHAAHLLSSHVQVPVGILGDFEGGLPFIEERLRPRTKSPMLVSMLGYTLGNLDRFEATFLRQLKGWLATGDYVLLEVLTVGERFDPAGERLPEHARARRFLANGISWQLGVSTEEILQDLRMPFEQRKGRSDVPGTVSIDFVDSGRKVTVQHVRYYQWSVFLEWIKDSFSFEVVKERNSFPVGEHTGGNGVVLLRQR